MKTILVTGGAGYVGSMLTRELLARDYRVVCVDTLLFGGESLVDLFSHPAFAFYKADVTDQNALSQIFSENKPYGVVHLASIVGDPACKAQPETATHTIFDGSRNVLEAAENHGVERFIFASTCSNYGKMETDAVLDEDAPLRPVSLYAELKVKVEQHLMERAANVDATVLRFATVYGLSLRPRFDLTINEFARDALLKGELDIYGPQFWRPYCHVRDIAAAIILILESARETVGGKTFNVGANDENYQKQMIAEEVAKQIPVKLNYVQKAEDPRDYRVDFGRIKTLGFVPQNCLADGIREVADCLKNGLITDPYSVRYQNSAG
jgi:nucleoside-diphosphate-sugar epimerase